MHFGSQFEGRVHHGGWKVGNPGDGVAHVQNEHSHVNQLNLPHRQAARFVF